VQSVAATFTFLQRKRCAPKPLRSGSHSSSALQMPGSGAPPSGGRIPIRAGSALKFKRFSG
jgi:hypothetical protein